MLESSDFRRVARQSLRGKWLLAAGTGLIVTLLGGGISSNGSITFSAQQIENLEEICYTIINNPLVFKISMAIISTVAFMSVAITITMLILGGAISMGYAKFNLNLINGSNPRVEDIFSQMKHFKKAFIMNFLRILFVTLWSFLFVIPGIVASLSYSMAPFVLCENPNFTGKQALDASKELMRGNKWRLFCLNLSFIGWSFLSIFTFGIGAVFLNAYISAAHSAFYREIKWQKAQQN